MPPKKDHFTTKKLLFNLAALIDLGEEITSDKDFKRIIRSSLYLAMGTVSASKGAILECRKGGLHVLAFKGIEEGVGDLEITDEEATLFKTHSQPFFFQSSSFSSKRLGDWQKLTPVLLAPMVVKKELIGLIIIGEKFTGEKYTREDIDILSIMAKYIGTGIYNHNLLHSLAQKVEENRRLYTELQLIYYDTIQAFAAAIDAKDAYTKGHSRRVARYCVALAEELGLSREEIEAIRIAGFLHDIGKIAIDKNIINKPSRPTEEERKELNQHPLISYEILSRVRFPWKEIPLSVRYHHERVDGKGYPDRLTGESIPLMARIMAVADAFDAMTTDRPYRRRLSLEEVLREFEREMGRQFDPKVAGLLVERLKKEIKGEIKERRLLLDEVEAGKDGMGDFMDTPLPISSKIN